MDFPAVTVCPLNDFAASKLYMTDDNPLFASSGLNISSCAVTSKVRSDQPCGWSLLCVLPEYETLRPALPNCTSQYREELLNTMQESAHYIDKENLHRYYSQEIESLVGPKCEFDIAANCSAKDFAPLVTQWSKCYTFNSGKNGKIKRVNSAGVSFGFSVILDAKTEEYSYGKFSEGFKVIIHKQGEFVDEWEGINVGPGQHAVIALSEKRYKNLEKPYSTNCSKRTLATFHTYTIAGCLYECEAEMVIKDCNCRPSGYKEKVSQMHACVTEGELVCVSNVSDYLDIQSCECEVPCNQTKYYTEVSYSKFPSPGTARVLQLRGYTRDLQYQRDNLVLLQVGFKSLSYEMQEQKPAYDSNTLFGDIGGSMGLFLGCSLLTICEFLDFFISLLATRHRRPPHPTSVVALKSH
ncbi:unnamed protein product [Porites evermanni]|uniref:Uncharacterized protein n=1 Tax=Porites evermanni TaxID=104178 RepID=A0ABN8QFS9_9CNID|nr:unnamed protein product [Porites evermanni]